MAAIKSPQTPTDLPTTEFVEFCIAEVLADLGAAESAAHQLEASLAFDVGCAFHGARQALDRALSIIAQAQPQPHIHRLAA